MRGLDLTLYWESFIILRIGIIMEQREACGAKCQPVVVGGKSGAVFCVWRTVLFCVGISGMQRERCREI